MSKFKFLVLILVTILVSYLAVSLPVNSAYAREPNENDELNLEGGSGGVTNDGIGIIDKEELGVPTDINEIIGNLVQLAYAAAGILFFFMFLLGGIRYITAGGDEKAAMSARGTLTQALIGLVIVVAAFVITQLLFSIFGIKGFISLG